MVLTGTFSSWPSIIMSKFKKGDPVVVIKQYHRDYPVGREFTVEYTNVFNTDIIYDKEEGRTSSFTKADCVEFSRIYNSPLYKALN